MADVIIKNLLGTAMIKSKPIDRFLSRFRRKPSPTETIGAPGTPVFGGFLQSDELNVNLGSRHERFKVFSEILANVSIVAAGTRYFLNLVAKAEWKFEPSEADTDGKFAALVKEMLTVDPTTPWHRIIRRAAMYRFYGFSVQEWTAKRREDGLLTFADIAPRAQLTLEKWDLATDGAVLGIIQRSPQTSEDLYLPREKVFYLVDDTLSDSPEGLGLFRHLVAPAARLSRYEQLEGFGYEADLRGVPIGRGPFTELADMVTAGRISDAQRAAIEAPLRDFVANHVKTAQLGILLDSLTYESKDESARPSANKQWDVELLKGSITSAKEIADAIERLNREMARILGVEQLMLGAGTTGSFALSRDKTSSFFLLVDGALTEIVAAVEDDLIDKLWELNGWDKAMKPVVSVEAIRFTDAEQVATVLRDMAASGAVLAPDDPVISEIRELMGVSKPTSVISQLDLALTGNKPKAREGEDGENVAAPAGDRDNEDQSQ